MSESPTEPWVLKFLPFASTVESSFWVRYCQQKLDTIRLSEQALRITAHYALEEDAAQPRLQLQESSLVSPDYKNELVYANGTLMGFNTVESFQQQNKNELLQRVYAPLFATGELNSFVLLVYADLKNHKNLYWFAMPCLLPSNPISAVQQDFLSNCWSREKCQNLAIQIDKMRLESETGCPPFFIATHNSCLPLTKESYDSLKGEEGEEVFFGFMDPASSSSETAKTLPLGWPMRNLVAFLSIHLNLGGKTVKVVCYRPRKFRRLDGLPEPQGDNTSLLLTVMVPSKEDYNHNDAVSSMDQQPYKVVGWELNARSKPGPRWVNLRPLLDETHLAIQAADLNLKLMKWRMIPSLKLELLQSTKVLLLGAGTLGCSVARILLGWGIRDLKFVDYGRVSYSNPVRQNLFTLQDCRSDGDDKASTTTAGSGSRPKAVAAAEALHSIAANVSSEGKVLSIPMPGHVESDRAAMEETVENLDQMVQDCDVVFLLTDTRESRWLPTVMAAAHNKILINAALGLDSWLVMRHGGGSSEQHRLGCYFCNDVVAPENSMKNRTLDQQCTVTRPGLAPVASSMAVELLIALLHHPQGYGAPAPSNATSSNYAPTVSSEEAASPLGIIPHQIRGSLVSYTMMTPTVPAFAHCTACSSPIVTAYREDKMGLVEKTCESIDGTFLENTSGLTAFRQEAASKMVDFEDWEEDE